MPDCTLALTMRLSACSAPTSLELRPLLAAPLCLPLLVGASCTADRSACGAKLRTRSCLAPRDWLAPSPAGLQEVRLLLAMLLQLLLLGATAPARQTCCGGWCAAAQPRRGCATLRWAAGKLRWAAAAAGILAGGLESNWPRRKGCGTRPRTDLRAAARCAESICVQGCVGR